MVITIDLSYSLKKTIDLSFSNSCFSDQKTVRLIVHYFMVQESRLSFVLINAFHIFYAFS
jgi:hypothetical protein